VTYRSGKSKGLAYVEYEDEPSAAKALMQTDNMLVGENQISVSISNPPKRGQIRQDDEVERPTNQIVSSLGSGQVKSSAKMRGKGHFIDLVPRALSLAKPVEQQQQQSMQVDSKDEQVKNVDTENKSKASMSNEDFRAFLLKKN
jgi:hypothetical protein